MIKLNWTGLGQKLYLEFWGLQLLNKINTHYKIYHLILAYDIGIRESDFLIFIYYSLSIK